MIPGLGIDMGPPVSSTGPSRKRSQTLDSTPQEFTASLNQYNNQRRQSQLPIRQSTSRSTISDRKVRIASGQPNVFGSASDGDDNDSDSSSSYIAPAPANRNRRLSVAVAAIADQDWDRSSSSSMATPSEVYSSDASPDTESSTASRSSKTSSLKRNMTVRRQRSQPDFSRDNTLIKTEAFSMEPASYSPPRAVPNGMARSKSAIGIATLHNNDSGSEINTTSLGRTKEIPRSGSRLANSGSSSRIRHARSATWDPRSAAEAMADDDRVGLVPDGFGGYVSSEEAVNKGKTVDEVAEDLENLERDLVAPQQVKRPLPPQPIAAHSNSSAQALKVGSFYGPDGSERARLDEDGRLSAVGSIYGHSAPQSVISMSTAPSQRSRTHSQSGPRPQFMASPAATNAASDSGAEDSRSVKAGSQVSRSDTLVPMRSHSTKFFKGLEGAETGEAMVSLDSNDTFSAGDEILPAKMMEAASQGSAMPSARTAHHYSASAAYISDAHHARRQSAPVVGQQSAALLSRSMTDAMGKTNAAQLDRQNTLISTSAGPARRAKELNRLLAGSGRKLSSASNLAGESLSSASTDSLALTASISRTSTNGITDMPPAALEQGRSGKNRVDVDLVLESDLVVEGGYLRGRLEIKVRKSSDKDGPLMLTQPKVRVVGFEELLNDDTRHIFYHHATVVDGSPTVGNGASQPYVLHGTPSLSPQADNRRPLACFASPADSEGYCVTRGGTHSVPFAMELPVGKGAKGSYRGRHAVVRYIVIGSVKLKSANGSNRSIAHFYRHVELFPYLNPAIVLSSSPRPIQASASKGLFLGGTGKVHLTASLHRSTWIAGQRVYVSIKIDNETSKKVKSLTLALVRTVTLFRPRPELDVLGASENNADPDACNTSTSRKKISEEVLEMGQKGTKGVVTAKGWWTGVDGGETVEISHNMKLPNDALTITRGRHVEVLYSIKASISSSLSSDVSVELPLRVVNFVSLDPPPLKSSCTKVTKNWTRENHQRNAMSESEAPMIEKMKYLEASRSPLNLSTGLGLEPAFQGGRRQSQPQPSLSGSRLQVPGGEKGLQHQKSLDFINHAIRSATARKTRSNEPSPTGLGIGLDENRTPPSDGSYYSSASSISGASMISSVVESIDPSCAPYSHHNPMNGSAVLQRGNGLYQHPVNLPILEGSLNDVGDDTYDDLGYGNQTLNLNDESIDEVDYVIGSAHLDGGESSPAFQQRQDFGNDNEYVNTLEDEESDLSTSTITSQRGIREADEYDEEDELVEQRQQTALMVPVVEFEDETTPLARSPPKFASNHASNRLPTPTRNKDSLPRMRINVHDSEDDYSSSASTSSRRSVVRTKSDVDCRLGRSSTIIKGPSASSSRPVSPSKQAASPTKSALKSQKSFPTANHSPVKMAMASPTKPPTTLKAKVAYSQISKAAPRGVAVSSSPTKVSRREPMSDIDSSASTSPASSVSVLTPESDQAEFTQDDSREESINIEARGSSNAIGLIDGLPNSSPNKQEGGRVIDGLPIDTISAMPTSKSLPALPRSTSVHSLQGRPVVVPSVRDKIAMLENRKQALRDFTGAYSPSATLTPTKLGGGTPNNTTPTHTPAAISLNRQLQRNDSILSNVSSQADYLKHTPSFADFKAPLLNTNKS